MSQDAALLVFISCELLTLNDSYIATQRENNLHHRSCEAGAIMVHYANKNPKINKHSANAGNCLMVQYEFKARFLP